MTTAYMIGGMLIMALMTYVIRMSPMIFFRKKIKNVRIKSFLYYVPYTVLAAMTFPAIFNSTESTPAAVAGCVVAVILAYRKKGLLVVALGAAATVLLCSCMGL